ncbi:MAG: hypothetical protein Q8S47_08660, partial [Phenylobacterium sp.]|nr:hypothetical protein [Phenylobacterium sp.]
AVDRRIPTALHVMVGEVLHNLRSALDNTLGAIALINYPSDAGVGFPFGRDVDAFKAELAKQKKLPSDARDIIAAAQPYQGGNHLLWALHELNRRDKHRKGLVPLNMPAETSVSYIIFERGLPFVMGSRSGQHLIVSPRPTHAQLAVTRYPMAFWDARPGRITFGNASSPGEESLEFMTTTPGAKFHADLHPTFSIGFTNVGLDGQPVTAVLNDMRDLVERLLLTFASRFFR